MNLVVQLLRLRPHLQQLLYGVNKALIIQIAYTLNLLVVAAYALIQLLTDRLCIVPYIVFICALVVIGVDDEAGAELTFEYRAECWPPIIIHGLNVLYRHFGHFNISLGLYLLYSILNKYRA